MLDADLRDILPESTQRKLERMIRMSPAEVNRLIAFVGIREYLFDHPFSAVGPRGDRVFSEDYLEFVVGLTGPGSACEHMSIDEIAQITGVDDEVLEVWLDGR